MSIPTRENALRRLPWALAVSVCLHGAALSWLPGNGTTRSDRAPPVLEVTLPPRLALATPPAPQLSMPVVEPRRHPPAPGRSTARPPAASAAERVRPAEALATPTEPSATLPAATTLPAVAATAAEPERLLAAAPPAAGPPSPQPDAAPLAAVRTGLEGYARTISAELGRNRLYPPLAQLRGWEGTATLRLHLSAEGRLREAAVASSSGREILDRQALAMAQQLAVWPPPPTALRGGEIVVLVPVVFRLEN